MKKHLLLLTASLSLTVAHSQQGWQFQNSSLADNQKGAICPISKDTVFAIADSGQFFKTYNGGTNWIAQNTGITTSFFDLQFFNADTGYAVGQKGKIIKTTNGGGNWITLTSGINKDIYSISILSANNLWAVGDSGIMLHSTNYGVTWSKNASLSTKQLNSVRFRNSNVGFIAGNYGTLFKTIDGGANWNTVTLATTHDLFSISTTPNYAYLLSGYTSSSSFAGIEIFRTNDDINWTNIPLSFVGNGISKLFFRNDSLGFHITSGCTTNGQCFLDISKTQNFGQTWAYSLISQPPATPGIQYSNIFFITDSIGYAFSGNNIVKTIDGGTYTNVGISEMSNGFNIITAPNPFSTQTTLQTAKPLINASLTVYNSVGQTVKRIDNLSGQTVLFHRDNLPSGLYFVRLMQNGNTISADKFVITDK